MNETVTATNTLQQDAFSGFFQETGIVPGHSSTAIEQEAQAVVLKICCPATGQPDDQPAGQPDDQPDDQPGDQPDDQQPADQPADQPDHQPADQPAQQPTRQPAHPH